MHVGLVLAWNILVDAMFFVATCIFLKNGQTPISRVKGYELHWRRSVHRMAGMDDIEFSNMTEIKRLLKVNTQRMIHNGKLEDDGEPLSPAGRLFHQPHMNCYIIVILGSGKMIDIEAVKTRMKVTILRHPRFSSILISDKPGSKNSRWIRTQVVLDDHIVIPKLNVPRESTSCIHADQLVDDYVSSLSTTGLPFSRPLWDIHLINIRTTKSKAVAIMRMHHSLGDGVSLMSLLLACTRKTSDRDSIPTLPVAKPQKRGSFACGGRLWKLLMCLCVVVMRAWNTVVDMVIFLATSAFLKDSETPIKGMEGVEFHRKRFVSKSLSLDDVKVIRNAFGCTINDVLMAIISSGLSQYLNRRYCDIANGEKKAKDILSNIRLRTALIVNIRPTPGIQELADMLNGGSSTMWGNWIGYVIVPIPLMMCDDPLDYVRKGIKIAARKRNTFEAVFTYIACCLSIKILGMKLASTLCHRLLRHTTVSVSNIVGPCDEVEFCGHSLAYLAASVYGHPQAVTLHFQSYLNMMEMVLAVDEQTVPDPHRLLEDFAKSLELIKDATLSRSSQS